MSLVGFETAILGIERPQNYALDRTVTGIGTQNNYANKSKKRTKQQNAQINFGLINLLLFNHSNVFRPLNRSHHQGVQNPWELQAIVVIC